MKNWINYKQLLLPLLAVILTVPSVSIATVNNNREQVESIRISISDLNLSRDEGIATLYQRLKSSASKVCETKYDVYVTGRIPRLEIKREFKRCYAKALSGAVQSINNQRLTDLHTSNT